MKQSNHRQSWTRWGFLILSLVTGLSLLVVGLMSMVFARENAAQVNKARAADLMLAARRSLALAGGQPEVGNLQQVLDDLADQEVVALGLLDAGGAMVVAVGRDMGRAWTGTLPLPGQLAMQEINDGARIRAADKLAGGRGRGQGPGRGWGRMRRMWGDRYLVLEFEPRLAQSLRSQAILFFGVGAGAALLLWLAAGMLWYWSRQAEQYARQLEDKRRLAALGEMSAVLGHEIRNPLASLKGHAQLLEEKLEQDHPSRKNAEQVLSESLRLEKLTLEILDFVRSGRLQLENGDLLALLRGMAEGAGASRVELDLPDKLPLWPMDKERLARALGNVLDNALQAAPSEGPVMLSLRLDTQGVSIDIRDRGPGVVTGSEAQIFEPFITGRIKGTGLGLAIAKRIVEGHGGRIQAANHPECGAVFSIWLPAERGVDS
ncbi:MAG: hypothetical protein JRF33_16830 [Deltaproteobacteria bacterium]|nr:hypothetical protein [Deltaproteobacteria bacterium]